MCLISSYKAQVMSNYHQRDASSHCMNNPFTSQQGSRLGQGLPDSDHKTVIINFSDSDDT